MENAASSKKSFFFLTKKNVPSLTNRRRIGVSNLVVIVQKGYYWKLEIYQIKDSVIPIFN